MANEFIIRKGYKSLSDSQITGSLSVSNAVTASFFTGSFRGDGSELTGIDGFPFTGSASISGSLTVVGPVTATEFIGNGSQLTGIEGFPYTGSAIISGSLQVTGSISTDTDATINSLTVGKGGGNLDTNTAVGYNAFSSNTGGNFNVAIGYNALASSVEGDDNVAIGYNALSSSLASMGPNTAVGRGALQNNLYGFRNTAIGNASLFSNIQGDFNTAVGNTALVSNIDGHENIAIGDGALYDNTVGDYNTGVGTFALHSNTGGNNNTAIGHSSLYYNLTGSNNIALGTDAGLFAGSGFTSLESVNNSIFVGYRTRALNAAGDTNEIVIGNNIVGLGSNTTVIGNNNTVSTTLKGAVSASLFSGSFVGDGSQLTGIADPTPITATIDNTDSPFTITSQSIVIVDSTAGNVTINLPDLDLIDGTPDQKPIIIYKNDYSQNVVYVSPSGSQLVNGASQDIIVSIQIGIVYNPTSAGWVTEGNSYQSLAELELFFVPRTETGSLSVATASYVEYADVVNKPTLVSGSSQISFSGITNKPTLVSGSSQISFSGITGKPTLVSGSSQVTYSGLTGIPAGIVSSSVQVKEYNVFATTGSNQFNGNQSITGSLTVSGQVVAQTLNVQQVTSSIVYSSGSNIFGNNSGNTHRFTGSLGVTGSLAVTGTGTFSNSVGISRTPSSGFKLDIQGNEGLRILDNDVLRSIIITPPNSGATGVISTASGQGLSIQATNVAGNLTFETAGVERMRITSGGNVGIGTDTITASSGYKMLAINGSTGGELELRGGGTAYGYMYANSGLVVLATQTSIPLVFQTAATERMRITSGGNVGIGTDSPSRKLQVVREGTSTSGDVVAVRNDNSTSGAFINFIAGGNNAPSIGAKGNDIVFTADNYSGTERMRITSGGNVGIGTPTPAVAGGGYTGLDIRGSGGSSVLLGTTSTSYGIVYASAGLFYVQSLNNSAIVFHTNSEAARITSGGNVLINTTSDNGAKLQVSGAATVSGDIQTSSSVRIGNSVQYTRVAANGNITTSITFDSTGGFWANNAVEILVSRANNLAPSGISKILVSMNQLNSSLSSVSTTTLASLGTGVSISTSVSGATITITLQTHTDSASRSVAHFNVISYYGITVS